MKQTKPKRQRQVWPIDQVMHLWAHQSQDSARSSQGNVFFEGDTIYSYGYHFPMARLFTNKRGKRLAIVTTKRYSSTTAGHVSGTRSALHGLMPIIQSSRLGLVPSLTVIKARFSSEVETILRISKVTSSARMTWERNRLLATEAEYNSLLKFLNRKPKTLLTKDIAAKVALHLDARLKRYLELNTPEMIAKREEASERKRRLKLAEDIEAFKSGSTISRLRDLRYALIRIDGDEIVTTKGARVQKEHALLLYRALKQGRDIVGRSVGPFKIDKVDGLDTHDPVIQAGCHTFRLSDIEPVLQSIQPRLVAV